VGEWSSQPNNPFIVSYLERSRLYAHCWRHPKRGMGGRVQEVSNRLWPSPLDFVPLRTQRFPEYLRAIGDALTRVQHQRPSSRERDCLLLGCALVASGSSETGSPPASKCLRPKRRTEDRHFVCNSALTDSPPSGLIAALVQPSCPIWVLKSSQP
jgi:hypothetical protein